ncbi:transposase (fragment) [Xenorhabdus bovienii SS-2004]|uniref:Transposase n=1 Tax=Xenorhabdus bovienii (strain SS-2004) TaxID=406818 RepID=D3V7N9_XENBS
MIEQDYRNIKRRTRPMLGFKNFRGAQVLFAVIDTNKVILFIHGDGLL